MITDSEIADPVRYVEKLSQYIADRRITLEICLTSNLQTNPNMKSLEEHLFKRLRAARLSTTICTDNRTVSNTTVTNEIMLAVQHLELDLYDLKSIIVYGFKRSFMPGTYLEKRAYVRKIIDHYESVEKRFLGEQKTIKDARYIIGWLLVCAMLSCQAEPSQQTPSSAAVDYLDAQALPEEVVSFDAFFEPPFIRDAGGSICPTGSTRRYSVRRMATCSTARRFERNQKIVKVDRM